MTGSGPRYVVDHIEGDRVVLVADGGERVDVRIGQLPFRVREGVVLSVPASGNVPDWRQAVRDEAEERRRAQEGRERLERLKRRNR